MFDLSRQLLLPTPADRVLWDVVGTHLDEAGFVFGQRRTALASSRYTISELHTRVDQRLRGHINALAVGGPEVAERIVYPELEETYDPDRASAAALVLLTGVRRDECIDVFDALSYSEGQQREAIARALVVFDGPAFPEQLKTSFETSRTLKEKTRLLEIIAARHIDPGDSLGQCLEMDYPSLIAAALAAAGRAGRNEFKVRVEGYLDHDLEEIRDAAREACLYFGSSAAWSRSKELARGIGPTAAKALLHVAFLGSSEDHQIIREQLEAEEMREAALHALGFTGRLGSADLCCDHLESINPRLAKIAAESIGTITGLDTLHEESLQSRATPEEDELVALEDDDLDANLVPDAVDELPAPDPSALRERYQALRGDFDSEERYLYGETFGPKSLVRALASASMRARNVCALELALRTGARQVVTTEAFASSQLEQMAQLSKLCDRDFVNFRD